MDCSNEGVMKMRYRHLEDAVIHDVTDQRRQQQELPYRYGYLQETDFQTVDGLLHGALPLDGIPKVKSKVIKIFISSTFTDMVEERNALAENVYPKLRNFCRDKYGVDFQAVDMRWGVPIEATNDHTVIDLCMGELYHCQHMSIGPNFAGLVGQRYGFVPTPAFLPRATFEAIRDNLLVKEHDVTVLDKCFVRDQNVVPSAFRLLEINKCCELTGKVWAELEKELKDIINTGAALAMANSDISEETKTALTRSVTELEMQAGLFAGIKTKDRENNTVMFYRDIDDLFDNLDAEKARRYVDLIPGANEVNGDAHVALNMMKSHIKQSLPRFNLTCASVHWTDQGIDPEVHKDYLDLMCNHFYHTIKDLVHRNMQQYSTLASDPLYQEVLQHWTLVSKRCLTFVGRKEPLDALRSYLTSETHYPLVVHGESGVGKTSFVAKAVSIARSVFSMKRSIIPRFIGITPKSNNIQQLLYSVCHQLAFVTGSYRHEVPEDYKSLKIYFIDQIQRGAFPGVVVIFLDSLDQLSSVSGGEKLDWLPAKIAPNIKIIVSTVPNKLGILDRLKGKFDEPMIEISRLPRHDCKHIMEVLLETSKRNLTFTQWRIVEAAFEQCTLPLFITLTFQEAIRWRSYDVIDAKCLEYTVDKSINKLFDRLEAKHGKDFVSRALGYITAAKSGLSETELEDILSLDDLVLNSVFTMWKPPIRRIPPSLWPRLYLDIDAFLVEKEADDIVVMGWYHQQFLDSATTRYLSDYVDYNQIHRNIADYYIGTYSGNKKKPFTYPEKLMHRLGRSDPYEMECRYVPEQPLVFNTSDTTERFNYRKMTNLPYSLIHSCQFESVKELCLCNYDWLHTKIRATSIQQVIADFSSLDDKESDLVADVLRMSGSALKLNPNTLGPEISGRLLPHIHRYPWIKELVKQCDLVSQKHCPLVPNCQVYTAPGGPLQYECELDENITSAIDVDVFNTQDGILMTAKPFHSTCLKVWELTQGEPRQDMHIPIGEVYPTRDGKYLAILKGSHQVLIYKTDSGEQHGQIRCDYGEVVDISMANRYLAFNIDRGVGPYVMDLIQAKIVHKFTYHSQAVTISKDESHVAFNSGMLILVHSLPLMERRCVGQASDIPVQLTFTSDARMCYVLTLSKLLQVMRFDPTNRKSNTHDIISDLDTKEIKLSHTEKYVLVRSLRCLYLVCTKKHQMLHRLMNAHPGVFVETMTCFSGADFSPNDKMVVASRYTYIFVWNAESGDPIRVLQASISPILKIYSSDTVNKAIALLRDNTLQVWNLDNLDANILHANEIFKCPIKSLAVSVASGKVLCHDAKHSEIKVVDLSSGKTADAIMQGDEVHRVSQVFVFANGRYGVARNVKAVEDQMEDDVIDTDRPESHRVRDIDWDILRDDVILDLVTKKKVFTVANSRYVVFDPQKKIAVGFVQCVFHSQFDWTTNLYNFITWYPKKSGEKFAETEHSVTFPEMSEFTCPPVIHVDRDNKSGQEKKRLLAVLQVCNKTMGVAGVEKSRTYDHVVFVQSLEKDEKTEVKMKTISDFLKHPEDGDKLAHVQVVSSNLILIIYVKGVSYFPFENKHGLTIPPGLEKGSILYNPVKDFVVVHIPRIFHRDTDLSMCLMSTTSSIRVDTDLRVFDTVSNRMLCQVKAEVHVESMRLALDGSYVVALCDKRRSVKVYRTSDGQQMGILYVHGTATCLEVGSDDRTIVVGCEDGRVLILSLILELSDPYVELIQDLKSRSLEEKLNEKQILQQDVNEAEKKHPELIRLASKIRSDVKVAERKQLSFKNLSNAVALSKQMNKAKSHACSLQ